MTETPESPSATIRRAATRMLELAGGCQQRAWHWEPLGEKRYPQRVSSDGNVAIIAETFIDPGHRPFEAEHIASWHPLVAVAVAGWLNAAAQAWDEGTEWDEALDVARAWLGLTDAHLRPAGQVPR